ncbi:mRNA-decapping enzyme subunit 2, partial [Chytridiales sp. JEL 0842]
MRTLVALLGPQFAGASGGGSSGARFALCMPWGGCTVVSMDGIDVLRDHVIFFLVVDALVSGGAVDIGNLLGGATAALKLGISSPSADSRILKQGIMAFRLMSFEEVLDDLQSRFIINVPAEELSSVERICFQIEQAHWFYEDFVREEHPNLPSFSLKNFSALFFEHCPLLVQWAHDHEKAFQTFMEYKVRVPVCGAIMLNERLDKVLLVKGWKSSSGWGFPKGKINKEESESECAVREVLEETGFDTGSRIKENDYVERTMKEQRIRLYIITGVPESTVFTTQTRKEIGDIKWFKLSDLPGWKREDPTAPPLPGKSRFYMVTAFVSSLKQWFSKYRKLKNQGKGKGAASMPVVSGYKSTTDLESDAEGGGLAIPDFHSRNNASEYTGVQAEATAAATDAIRALLGIGMGGSSKSHLPAAPPPPPSFSTKSQEDTIKALIGIPTFSSASPGSVLSTLESQQEALKAMIGAGQGGQASGAMQSLAQSISFNPQQIQPPYQPMQQPNLQPGATMQFVTMPMAMSNVPGQMPIPVTVQIPNQMGGLQGYLTSPAPGMNSPAVIQILNPLPLQMQQLGYNAQQYQLGPQMMPIPIQMQATPQIPTGVLPSATQQSGNLSYQSQTQVSQMTSSMSYMSLSSAPVAGDDHKATLLDILTKGASSLPPTSIPMPSGFGRQSISSLPMPPAHPERSFNEETKQPPTPPSSTR